MGTANIKQTTRERDRQNRQRFIIPTYLLPHPQPTNEPVVLRRNSMRMDYVVFRKPFVPSPNL